MIVMLRAKGKALRDVVECKEEEKDSSCEGPAFVAWRSCVVGPCS
jgi:hypothetical protein